jgi:hypothetical protein
LSTLWRSEARTKEEKVMKDSTFTRWMGPVGLLAVVALFVGFGPLGGGSPGENASGVTVANWYNSHVGQSWGSIYAVSLGAALLIFFLVHLRTVLRQSGEHLLPNVVLFASIVMLAGLMVAGVNQVVLILAAHNHEFGIVHTANFVSTNNEFGIIFGLALLTLSTGLCILVNRQVPLPKTLGWYSILVAILCCAGPLSGLAFIFGLPIWVIATGFVLTVKARRGTLGPAEENARAANVTPPVTPVQA